MLEPLKKTALSDIFHAHADECTTRLLTTRDDIQKFMNLHLDVYWSLPAAQQHFYKRVNYPRLTAHLNAGNHIIGVIGPDDETLLAGARLTLAKNVGKAALPDFPLDGPINPSNTAIIQTLSAHPKTNGNGGKLASLVFAGVADAARAEGMEWVLGKLAYGNANPKLNNEASFKTFQRNGYGTLMGPTKAGLDFYKSLIVAKHLGIAG